MKKWCGAVLLVLLTLPWTARRSILAQDHSQTKVSQGMKKNDDGWVRDNYNLALDLIFPDPCASAISGRWMVCIRSIPSFKNEIEYSFSVEKRYDGTILTRITRPKGRSIYRQLCERKKQYPLGSVNELSKKIRLESRKGDQAEFPQLTSLASEFEKLSLSPVLSDEIMIDPVEYDITVRSFSGESERLTLHGPGSAASHRTQPLVHWAEATRESLATGFHGDNRLPLP
jgi:hypothetical protein